MAETDAFGNKIDKDGTSPAPAPSSAAEATGLPASDTPATTTPAAPPAPPSPPAPTGLTLSGRPSRFGGGGGGVGRWIGVLILVGVIAAGVIIAINAANDAQKVINRFTPTQPALTVAPDASGNSEGSSTTDSPQPDKPVPDPVGLGPRSLIRAEHFGAAMAKLRKAHLGHVRYVRVSPARIDVQLITDSGRIRNMAVGVLGDVHQFGTVSGPGFSTADTIPFSQIDAGAPERLVRGAVRHGGVRANGIDYLVGQTFGGKVVWNAFFKNNVRYQGDQAGNVQGKF